MSLSIPSMMFRSRLLFHSLTAVFLRRVVNYDTMNALRNVTDVTNKPMAGHAVARYTMSMEATPVDIRSDALGDITIFMLDERIPVPGETGTTCYVIVSAIDIFGPETAIWASNAWGDMLGNDMLHEFRGMFDIADAMRRAGFTIMI